MGILIDIAIICFLIVSFLAGMRFGKWIGYRYIPTVIVKHNGVIVGRITEKKYDNILARAKKNGYCDEGDKDGGS